MAAEHSLSESVSKTLLNSQDTLELSFGSKVSYSSKLESVKDLNIFTLTRQDSPPKLSCTKDTKSSVLVAINPLPTRDTSWLLVRIPKECVIVNDDLTFAGLSLEVC